MFNFRLVLLMVLCVCLAGSIRGQSPTTDPTSTCYDPYGSVDGQWVTDVGFWDLNAFQSTYSSYYSVLCAYRGLYLSGPAGSNVAQWGPWHGNPNDTNCNSSPVLSQFANFQERGRPGFGSYGSRTNAASGNTVLTHIRVGGWCDSSPDNSICAGNCVGSKDYDDNQAVLQQDASYQVVTYNDDSAALLNYVITTQNTTQRSDGVTSVRQPIKTEPVSAITSVSLCYGQENLQCPQ